MKNAVLCAVLALLPVSLPADERGAVEPKPVIIDLGHSSHEMGFDWNFGPAAPRSVGFEYFSDDSSPAALRRLRLNATTPDAGPRDNHTAALGDLAELLRQHDELIKQRDELKRRVTALEALIQNLSNP